MNHDHFKTGRFPLLWLLIPGLLALFPLTGPPVYFLSFVYSIFLYVCVATSWNLIGGYAGYLSFGHVAFFGIGAYGTALISNAFHLSAVGTILSSIPAGGIAALTALIIGYPCLRLKGPYFAVITLCFAFVVHLTVQNLGILGGPDGLWLKAMDASVETSRSILYELMLVVMVITVAVSVRINRSKFGAGLRAIKEDEEVAQTMGINAPRLKMQAFVLSAFFPGVAGGLHAYYLTYIHPSIVFDVNMSILIVLMALFGGGASWLGPVIGATLLSVVNELLSTFVKAELARIIYGSLFVAVIIFLPHGIMQLFKKSGSKPRIDVIPDAN